MELFQDAASSHSDDSHPHNPDHSPNSGITADNNARGQNETNVDEVTANDNDANYWKWHYQPKKTSKAFTDDHKDGDDEVLDEDEIRGDILLGHHNSISQKHDKTFEAIARVRHSITSGLLSSSQRPCGCPSQADSVITRVSSFKKRRSEPEFKEMRRFHHQWKPPLSRKYSQPGQVSFTTGSSINKNEHIVSQSHMTNDYNMRMSPMSTIEATDRIGINKHMSYETQPERQWHTVKGVAALNQGFGIEELRKDSIVSNHAPIGPKEARIIRSRQRRKMAMSFHEYDV